MECKNCPAYGRDNIGFMGCLIKHSMLDKANGKVGCYQHNKTITKKIIEVKINEPRARNYKWVHENISI